RLMRSCIDLLGLSSATMVHAYANSSIQACPCYALIPHAPRAHAASSCAYLCERVSSSRVYPLLCTRHPSTASCSRGLVPLLMCLSSSHTSSYPPLGPCVHRFGPIFSAQAWAHWGAAQGNSARSHARSAQTAR
ncbi:Unknown protein, partial [Striga hermonthica]